MLMLVIYRFTAMLERINIIDIGSYYNIGGLSKCFLGYHQNIVKALKYCLILNSNIQRLLY